MTKKNTLPVILLILDGWGIAPPSRGNAIKLAKTPTMDLLQKKYPTAKLHASGRYVGLPDGHTGNSEAGHLNIGAGRIVDQDATKINKYISQGTFFRNPIFINALRFVKKNNSSLHLMGLITSGKSAHAEMDHLYALISLARKYKIKNVYLHLFTDGRDAPTHGALKLIISLNKVLVHEKISTIMGRFYAMDRKKFWNRTQAAYEAMVLRKGKKTKNPETAISEAYNEGNTDEFIPPYVIHNGNNGEGKVSNNDAIIFFNLRSDRARQITKTFVQNKFEKMNEKSFTRKKVLKNIFFVAMTNFGPDLENVFTAYPDEPMKDTMPIMLKDYKQVYITEAEKYAHMTYFINGGYPNPVAKEKRIKVLSPNVKFYDESPEMAIEEITRLTIQHLKTHDFIALNFSSADMIGHTGNLQATIKAVEFIDQNVTKLYKEVLRLNGTLIITADHGNAEDMISAKTNEHLTEHTTNLVPFIVVSKKKYSIKKRTGSLCDILPTILYLFSVKPSRLITGRSIIK